LAVDCKIVLGFFSGCCGAKRIAVKPDIEQLGARRASAILGAKLVHNASTNASTVIENSPQHYGNSINIWKIQMIKCFSAIMFTKKCLDFASLLRI
jgi:hypothetical protein